MVRNATRDYVDFSALGNHPGPPAVARALARFDELYPQESGESAARQPFSQIAFPRPYDLGEVDLRKFKGLDARWSTWEAVSETCEKSLWARFGPLCPSAKGFHVDGRPMKLQIAGDPHREWGSMPESPDAAGDVLDLAENIRPANDGTAEWKCRDA